MFSEMRKVDMTLMLAEYYNYRTERTNEKVHRNRTVILF